MKNPSSLAGYMNLYVAMERALKGANIPVLMTDASLRSPGPKIVFVNRAFCASTGYKEKELLGQTPRILQGPLTDHALLKRLSETLKNGDPFQGETVNYRKDGTTYVSRWNISPICDDNGRITHFVSFQVHRSANA
jgi:PAS domain S-box-containing protein